MRFLLAIPKALLFEGALALILFGTAGRIDLPWVWALLAVHGTLLTIAFTFMDPTLARERARPGPGAWDGYLRRILAVLLLIHLVIAGLDVGRFHWSGPIALPVRIAALVVFTCGMGFSIWASIANRFFSSAIRLQTDRGHHVIDTGPYQWVRHPGYAGMVVAAIAGGVVIGSWWSLVPLALMGAVVVRRLLLEDAFLHRELGGYTTYAGRVRYKLVPGLW
jgi:protein-S-isoprenylcysteine O-methyltransferase Ste14